MKEYRILGRKGRITIPLCLRQKLGVQPGEVVSFEETKDNAILIRREKLPAAPAAMPTLKEFLESLSDTEQYAAMVHLTTLWAEKHPGTGGYGRK